MARVWILLEKKILIEESSHIYVVKLCGVLYIHTWWKCRRYEVVVYLTFQSKTQLLLWFVDRLVYSSLFCTKFQLFSKKCSWFMISYSLSYLPLLRLKLNVVELNLELLHLNILHGCFALHLFNTNGMGIFLNISPLILHKATTL